MTIPSGIAQANLSFWSYPISGDAGPIPTPQPRSPSSLQVLEKLTYDVQYLLILDQSDNWIGTMLWQCTNDQTWGYHTYDLGAYAGRTIKLQFGSYNTGNGGVTSMYLDNVSLQLCW